jgi:hypothetical protein
LHLPSRLGAALRVLGSTWIAALRLHAFNASVAVSAFSGEAFHAATPSALSTHAAIAAFKRAYVPITVDPTFAV